MRFPQLSKYCFRSLSRYSNTNVRQRSVWMMSCSVTMFACFKFFSRDTSLIAVQGAPSSCSSRISFNATRFSVSLLRPLNTVAYVPSPSLPSFTYVSSFPKPMSDNEARRDMRLRGLQSGEFSLSSCSFLRNSGGRRMSMGRDMRLLTSSMEKRLCWALLW